MSKTTKQAQIIETLSTKEGASIDEMMKLTGWQKHYADARIMPM
jgi:hypothetical protein